MTSVGRAVVNETYDDQEGGTTEYHSGRAHDVGTSTARIEQFQFMNPSEVATEVHLEYRGRNDHDEVIVYLADLQDVIDALLAVQREAERHGLKPAKPIRRLHAATEDHLAQTE